MARYKKNAQEKAKSLAEKGDFDQAVSLANTAKFEGEQAVEQGRATGQDLARLCA